MAPKTSITLDGCCDLGDGVSVMAPKTSIPLDGCCDLGDGVRV